ncbi:MAG: alpha/beta hydrolase [Mailhella sp.]|nr:alpha/beta hydrolase [Mailhella sp.]
MAGLSNPANCMPLDMDALVHPDLRDIFASLPKTEEISIEGLRRGAAYDPKSLGSDAEVTVEDRFIGKDGLPKLRVRVYSPARPSSPRLPAVLWIHGGGHLRGTPERSEGFSKRLVKTLNCIVVSPDYRLAPENPFPADTDDCYAALEWLADTENNGLPIDATRIAVMGASAGGGLAVSTALKARDLNGPKIRFLLSLYPMLDCRLCTASSRQITDSRVINRAGCEFAWQAYLGGFEGMDRPYDWTAVSPYASPSLAEDVSGLPPAYFMIGGLDPLRDETIAFAQLMMAAGIPTELHVIPGAFHAFELIARTQLGVMVQNEYIEALRKGLGL